MNRHPDKTTKNASMKRIRTAAIIAVGLAFPAGAFSHPSQPVPSATPVSAPTATAARSALPKSHVLEPSSADPSIHEEGRAPEPVDAAMRREAFARRNHPGALRPLARTLASMLKPDVPGLAGFRRLVDQGNDAEALGEFHRWFFAKLGGAPKPARPPGYGFKPPATTPEQLMAGVAITAAGKTRLLGEPGAVNWEHAAPPVGENQSHEFWHPAPLRPLLAAYLESKNPAWLARWCAYLDDWAIHAEGLARVLPADVPDGDNFTSRRLDLLLADLRQLGEAAGGAPVALPSPTLARVLVRVLREYPAVSVTYMRTNPQNWTEMMIRSDIQVALKLDEFKVGDWWLREAIRRMEDLEVTHGHPDGTGTENILLYKREYYMNLAEARDLLRRHRPDLLPPEKERALNESLIQSARWIMRLLTPGGRLPAGFRNDYRVWSGRFEQELQEHFPEALEDADIKTMLAMAKGSALKAPPFTSESYPYGGYFYLRQGWDQDSHYALFYAPSQPGVSASTSIRNGLTFNLQGFGRDLLVPGEVGVYGSDFSPLVVDGRHQFRHRGIPSWHHRGALVVSHQTPHPTRWHTSDRFDLAEGSYRGGWSDELRRFDKIPQEVKAAMSFLEGVEHHRELVFVRQAGLWIVTDRLLSDDPHTYTQHWRLPVGPVAASYQKVYPAFEAAQVVADEAAQSVQTRDREGANLSLYTIAARPLTYRTATESKSDSSYRISDFLRIEATLDGRGNETILTVLFPRKDAATDLAAIEPIRVTGNPRRTGFTARLPDGSSVSYLTTTGPAAPLRIGNVEAEARALLVATRPDGEVSGMVLDAGKVSIDGRRQHVAAPDFEFVLAGGTISRLTAIHRPIGFRELTATPDTNVFTESQNVSLRCAVPGTEIRYTLDGSEPTPDSPLYRQPLRLTRTTTLKARALRQGLEALPAAMSHTLAGPVRTFTYTRQVPREPEAGRAGRGAGLHYRYYEGDWPDLLTRLDDLTPAKAGPARGLFDFAAGIPQGPCAYAYDGFLNVPQDGVYTFHAPPEWLLPNIMAGYDLQVHVGGRQWYPGTRHHAFGDWSIPLKKGAHRLHVRFVDFRGDSPARHNTPGLPPRVWPGDKPDLRISGPGVDRQPIPAAWLQHERTTHSRDNS